MTKFLGWILLITLTALLSCTRKDAAPTSAQVNLAIWGNYISPETQQKFTQETGIRLNISNYSSNEELLAKIQTGSSGIDVAVPSDYMVGVMTKLGLLENLQKEKIPNQSNLSPEVTGQAFDPENKVSLPYGWATAGIAVNRDLYKGEVKGWKDLLDNPALNGKFALLDDVREVTGAALKMHGHSVNTTDAAELAKAKETLLKARKGVKMFTSDTIDILKNKEVAAAQTYSTDALQASRANPSIEYIIPSEGSTRSIDNLVIVKGSKNVEAAHKLINYLLSKESEIAFVKGIMVGPVLAGIKAELPPELQQNKALFPTKESLSRLERITDLGDQNGKYEEIWTAVKTAR